MTLSSNQVLQEIQGGFNDFAVKASSRIYQGAFVGSSAGLARPLVAADAFMGIAWSEADNSSGSDSDINVKVRFGTFRMIQKLTGVAITNLGDSVYASADDTLTLSSSGNSLVGQISRWLSTGVCEVEFETLA